MRVRRNEMKRAGQPMRGRQQKRRTGGVGRETRVTGRTSSNWPAPVNEPCKSVAHVFGVNGNQCVPERTRALWLPGLEPNLYCKCLNLDVFVSLWWCSGQQLGQQPTPTALR